VKRLLASLVIFFCALATVGSGQALADTVVRSQTIHITATVAPMRCIIVNQTGQIIEITSNTPEPVKPRVFIDKVRANTERSLSPEIYSRYQNLISRSNLTKPGVIYRQTKVTPAQRQAPSFIAKLLGLPNRVVAVLYP